MGNNNRMKNLLNARNAEHNDGQHRNIARRGSVPKTSNDGAPVHPHMTRQQTDAAGLGGMGHASAAVVAVAPLQHAYGNLPDSKTGKGVLPKSGQKSQTNMDCEDHGTKVEHGRAMLSQAVKC